MRRPPATRRACFAAATPSGTAGASRPSTPADSEVDDLAADQLERFPGLAIYRDRGSGSHSASRSCRPSEHRTSRFAFTGDLDTALVRLAAAVHEQRPNPYHGPDDVEEVTLLNPVSIAVGMATVADGRPVTAGVGAPAQRCLGRAK